MQEMPLLIHKPVEPHRSVHQVPDPLMAPRYADDANRNPILNISIRFRHELHYRIPAVSELYGSVLLRRARCGFEVRSVDARVREGLFATQEASTLDMPEGGLVGEFLGQGSAETEGGLVDGVGLGGAREVDVRGVVAMEMGIVG